MIVIGICDDSEKDVKLLEKLCADYFSANDEYKLLTFSSGEMLLDYAFSKTAERIDLLFLDIQMHGINGIQVKDEVIKCPNIWRIVFVTSHTSMLYSGFGIKTIGYIEKPVSFDMVRKWIEFVITELEEKIYFEVEELVDYINGKIRVEDIMYFKADGSYVELFIRDSEGKGVKYATIAKNLKFIESIIDNYQFVRVHNSYLINMVCIENIKVQEKKAKYGVKMFGQNELIPIGRKYMNTAMMNYNEFVKNTVRKRMR